MKKSKPNKAVTTTTTKIYIPNPNTSYAIMNYTDDI